jgi:hypothetical protein
VSRQPIRFAITEESVFRREDPEVIPIPPPTPSDARPESEKATDGWFRELKDGRLEVMLKTPYTRLRLSGHADHVWQAVEMFEEWTGKVVAGEWKRPSTRGAKPIEGQIDIFMTERLSEDGNE